MDDVMLLNRINEVLTERTDLLNTHVSPLTVVAIQQRALGKEVFKSDMYLSELVVILNRMEGLGTNEVGGRTHNSIKLFVTLAYSKTAEVFVAILIQLIKKWEDEYRYKYFTGIANTAMWSIMPTFYNNRVSADLPDDVSLKISFLPAPYIQDPTKVFKNMWLQAIALYLEYKPEALRPYPHGVK